jgi:tRNA (cmo5U34)-methyltransferase
VGVDASAEMLERAASVLPAERVELRVGRLEDALPGGPFDLVVSVLAVHHLDGPGKAELFARAREVLAPGGRLVIGDVVVPEDPADAVTPIDGDYDKPSGAAEQLEWLAQAGLAASVAWSHRDLAVLVGELS